ncbi:MAG: hypothetical protein KIT14_00985 [bacterium]|nr:hypothetical protein [bacterium]
MRSPFLVFGALLLAVGTAAAGTISISIVPTATLEGDDLTVKLRVNNSGDEAALSVTPKLVFRDAEVRGKGTPRLEPGTDFEETLSIPAGQLTDGRWPYKVAVDYTDLNQYPFQALQVQSLVIGNPPPAKVAVARLESDGIAGSGSVRVQLKNLTADERKTTVSMLLPEGLETGSPRQEITLDGWEERAVDVPVTNRTALPGSRYPVFIAVEYEDGNVHQGLVSQGVVAIEVGETFLDRHRSKLPWIAGGFVLLWLILVTARAMRRQPA